jgi:hypothetical protein
MIMKEATVGGTVHLDYLESEMALPEAERVAFDYRPLTNRERVDLLHRTTNSRGAPNGAEVCQVAVTKIRNLTRADGQPLDTVEKLMAYPDKDNSLAYMIVIIGSRIWARQAGEEVGLKNSP